MDTRAYGNNLGIYLATFCLETATGIFRALALAILCLPLGFLTAISLLLFADSAVDPGLMGEGLIFTGLGLTLVVSLLIGGLLAFLPLGFSVLSYWGAGGGYAFTRFTLGARPPSTREWERLQEELNDIQNT